jgi:hypothetical protein
LHEGIDQRPLEQTGVVLLGPGRGGTDAFAFRFWTKLEQKMGQITLGESSQVRVVLNVVDNFFPLGELAGWKRRQTTPEKPLGFFLAAFNESGRGKTLD